PSLPVYAYPGAAPEEANGISQAIWQPSPDGRMRGRKAYSSHARAQASGPYATFQNECCSAARSQSKRAALYAPVAPGYPGLSEYSQQGLAAAGVSPMRMLRPFDAHLSTPAEVATMGTQQTASNLSSPRTISAYGPTYCAPAYVGGNSIEMQSAYNLMATQTPLLPAYVFHGSPSDTAHPLDGSPSDLAQPLDHRGMRMTPQVFTLTCSEQRPLRVATVVMDSNGRQHFHSQGTAIATHGAHGTDLSRALEASRGIEMSRDLRLTSTEAADCRSHLNERRSKQQFIYSTNKTSYFMEPGDPNPVLLTRTTPDESPALHLGGNVHLGLVSMLKKPAHIETWLTYYRDVIGIERFFLKVNQATRLVYSDGLLVWMRLLSASYVEDTPELEPLFAQEPWCNLVDTSFDEGTQRDYFAQMDRQSTHMANTIPKVCLILFLIPRPLKGIGADRLRAELAQASSKRPDLHMMNVEALFPSESCGNPFKEATVFRHCPTKYCSYTNGKSFGRCLPSNSESHRLLHICWIDSTPRDCDRTDHITIAALTHMIPPWVATVLHYESATYRKWRRKFVELAARHGTDPKVFARVPFTFYKRSIQAAYQILTSAGDPEKLRLAEAAALDLWREYKLAPAGCSLHRHGCSCLPPPIPGKPQISSRGFTVLSPWLVPREESSVNEKETDAGGTHHQERAG
ncbi:MAG: hypothetical protein SGPRY_005259, partial [Prymnesium sp.]